MWVTISGVHSIKEKNLHQYIKHGSCSFCTFLFPLSPAVHFLFVYEGYIYNKGFRKQKNQAMGARKTKIVIPRHFTHSFVSCRDQFIYNYKYFIGPKLFVRNTKPKLFNCNKLVFFKIFFVPLWFLSYLTLTI